MIEYNDSTSTALVYHLGNHKCGLQVDTQKRNSLIKSRIQDRKLAGSAKEVSLVEIGCFIESGQMDLAKSEADAWVDCRAVKRQMNIVNSSGAGDHNSFDAVWRLKWKTDESDKYYICHVITLFTSLGYPLLKYLCRPVAVLDSHQPGHPLGVVVTGNCVHWLTGPTPLPVLSLLEWPCA